MPEDPFLMLGAFVSMIAGCSAIGGCVAYAKRRSPMEGVLLGLFLGPIGALIECRLPYLQRPIVDRNAWNSLNTLVTYQQTDRDFPRRSSRSKRTG